MERRQGRAASVAIVEVGVDEETVGGVVRGQFPLQRVAELAAVPHREVGHHVEGYLSPLPVEEKSVYLHGPGVRRDDAADVAAQAQCLRVGGLGVYAHIEVYAAAALDGLLYVARQHVNSAGGHALGHGDVDRAHHVAGAVVVEHEVVDALYAGEGGDDGFDVARQTAVGAPAQYVAQCAAGDLGAGADE